MEKIVEVVELIGKLSKFFEGRIYQKISETSGVLNATENEKYIKLLPLAVELMLIVNNFNNENKIGKTDVEKKINLIKGRVEYEHWEVVKIFDQLFSITLSLY